MNKTYLSLGTNMGDREQNLKQAVAMLQEMPDVEVTKVSSIYETAPVGYTEQASFLNIALLIETNLSALALLERCQSVENELGRVREVRWGPRIIDLDILLFNNENIEVENLTVPHPRMFERAFVLVPLMEIAEQLDSPHLQLAKDHLARLDVEEEVVEKWKTVRNVMEFLQ